MVGCPWEDQGVLCVEPVHAGPGPRDAAARAAAAAATAEALSCHITQRPVQARAGAKVAQGAAGIARQASQQRHGPAGALRVRERALSRLLLQVTAPHPLLWLRLFLLLLHRNGNDVNFAPHDLHQKEQCGWVVNVAKSHGQQCIGIQNMNGHARMPSMSVHSP